VSAQRKILVVDDTAMFRDLGSIFLARFGSVLTAAGGEQAYAIARRERPDVIVTDLDMPGGDGETLCRMIRADEEIGETPLIVIVAGDFAKDRARAVRAGADDVVAKPISRMSLVQSVRHFLRVARHGGLTRVPVEMSVYLRTAYSEVSGLSRNLSRGGICVDAPMALPCETEVEVAFHLPETPRPLLSTARVVWERPASERLGAGMGMQFLAIDRESSHRIENFVYAHAKEDSPAATGSVPA
jgi:uncharacterized protein (TIGR02266 family)